MAWDQVCNTTDAGGLGIRHLDTQNTCLLIKLVHRLHQDTESSWAKWVKQHTDLATMEGDITGPHWEALRDLLPLYQAITTVQLGDGAATSFWYDVWLGDDCFADRFRALLSHCTRQNQSVRTIAMQGIVSTLQPRLTPQAQTELATVQDLLSSLQLTATPDRRHSHLMDGEGKLQTSALYALLQSPPNSQTEGHQLAWKNHAPPRVKFFAWLLTRKKIQCRSNLQKRGVLDDATCEVCGNGDENANHIIFSCSFASEFWSAIGFVVPADADVSHLDKLDRPAHIPSKHFSTLLLLCCWQLWKRRNGVIFRQEEATK